MLPLPDPRSSTGYGEQNMRKGDTNDSDTRLLEKMQDEDIRQHLKNKHDHSTIYDPWGDESPAGIGQQFSVELRQRLHGYNPQD